MPGGMPPGMPGAIPAPGGGPEIQSQIASLQSVVARDPKNVQAWVMLGNAYFDTGQPQKSVEAYGRALELKPNDPDVLTDQGVMYRALGQFDKAVANFEKANKTNPTHVQSLYNLGVVYSSDLHQNDKAAAALNKVIQTAPSSPQAAQAKQLLAEIQARK
jgi:cytochrome c-type biogenesis protein CcmH/NrfG